MEAKIMFKNGSSIEFGSNGNKEKFIAVEEWPPEITPEGDG